MVTGSQTLRPFLWLVIGCFAVSSISIDRLGAQGTQNIAQHRSLSPIVLFDGSTKRGWGKKDGADHDGWVVHDGALYRKSGGGDLYFQGEFRDFILHFQWKISPNGNSGLKYRVRQYGRVSLGCEYQILDDTGNKRERIKSASLYDIYDPVENKPVVQAGVWQSGKIVVCGNRIEHWLNGVVVVQTTVGSPDWKAKVAESKFRNREKFGENRTGRIFLQDHGNPVWFRQIVLVPLNCDPLPIEIAEQPTHQHFVEASSLPIEPVVNPCPMPWRPVRVQRCWPVLIPQCSGCPLWNQRRRWRFDGPVSGPFR